MARLPKSSCSTEHKPTYRLLLLLGCLSAYFTLFAYLPCASAQDPSARPSKQATPTQAKLAKQAKGFADRGKPRRAAELLNKAIGLGKLNILYFNLGRTWHKAGPEYCSKAAQAYRDALTSPTIQGVDPASIDSKIRSFLSELEATCPAQVRILCDPVNLSVSYGERGLAQCGDLVEVPPGSHTFRGGNTNGVVQSTINVAGASQTTVRLSFKDSARLSVSCDDKDASVAISGLPAMDCPVVTSLSPDKYTLTVSVPDAEPFSQVVTLVQGKTTTVDIPTLYGRRAYGAPEGNAPGFTLGVGFLSGVGYGSGALYASEDTAEPLDALPADGTQDELDGFQIATLSKIAELQAGMDLSERLNVGLLALIPLPLTGFGAAPYASYSFADPNDTIQPRLRGFVGYSGLYTGHAAEGNTFVSQAGPVLSGLGFEVLIPFSDSLGFVAGARGRATFPDTAIFADLALGVEWNIR